MLNAVASLYLSEAGVSSGLQFEYKRTSNDGNDCNI